MMEFDTSIFKPYDIRGNVSDQITPDIAYRIGNALVVFLKPTTIAVGCGVGRSIGELRDAIVGGIIDAGSDIIDIGETTPDALHLAVGKYNLDGGVMITPGFGNPDEVEVKICRKQAMPLSGRHDLDKIRIALEDDTVKRSPNRGNIARKDINPEFVEHCLSKADIYSLKPLRLMVEAHGGAAGDMVQSILKRLPVKIECELINSEISRSDDEKKRSDTSADLISKIIEKKADLGIEFDPAGGRIMIFDSKGQVVPGDLLTALVGSHLLRKNPGETILYSLICSRTVPELIEKNGGVAIKTRVGPSLIRPMMKKHDALFGGEPSGYFYYREHWFADSSMITFLNCLEIISRNNEPLYRLIEDMDHYFRSGEITVRANSAREKIEMIAEKYASGTQDRLDGLSVEMSDFWFNIRFSNTEPAVRLNVEATRKELLVQKMNEIMLLISS